MRTALKPQHKEFPHRHMKPAFPILQTFRIIVFFCLSTALVNSCSNDESLPEPPKSASKYDFERKASAERDTLRAAKVRAANAAIERISYRRTVIDTKELLDSIRRVYAKRPATMTGYRAFTTVNRKDLHYFRLGDTVLLPAFLAQDLRAYSVFPHYYPEADTLPKIILISNKYQCYACYEKGVLVRFAACNTGEERKPTFPGRYTLNWKDKKRRSSLDSNWVLPFTWNFHLFAGSAFHQFDMPGRPVSHSCVRQFMDDAEWLFNWGKGGAIDTAKRKYIPMTGTPVIIMDIFDFSRKKGGPWWELTSNKDSLLTLPKNPMAVEEALIPMSQIPHEIRYQLPQRERYVWAEDTLRARGMIRPNVELMESINYNKLRRIKTAAKLAAARAKIKAQEKVNPSNAAQ